MEPGFMAALRSARMGDEPANLAGPEAHFEARWLENRPSSASPRLFKGRYRKPRARSLGAGAAVVPDGAAPKPAGTAEDRRREGQRFQRRLPGQLTGGSLRRHRGHERDRQDEGEDETGPGRIGGDRKI